MTDTVRCLNDSDAAQGRLAALTGDGKRIEQSYSRRKSFMILRTPHLIPVQKVSELMSHRNGRLRTRNKF